MGYLTRLDHFLLGSTALVFLAQIEVTAAAWFDGRNRTSLTLRLDQHSRWLFPVAYVGLSAFVFLV